MSDLEPCPWCRTTRLHLDCFGIKCGPGGDEQPTDWRVMHDEGQEPKCEAWGPECDTREQAIAAWNRRAPSTAFRAGAEAMRERAVETAEKAVWCPCGGPPCQTPAGHGCGVSPAEGVEVAVAIRALPLPAGGSGWRPIETAPRDGTFVLLHVPDGLENGEVTIGAYWKADERDAKGRFMKGNWDGWLGMDVDIRSSWCDPTHWQPLPAAPEEGG